MGSTLKSATHFFWRLYKMEGIFKPRKEGRRKNNLVHFVEAEKKDKRIIIENFEIFEPMLEEDLVYNCMEYREDRAIDVYRKIQNNELPEDKNMRVSRRILEIYQAEELEKNKLNQLNEIKKEDKYKWQLIYLTLILLMGVSVFLLIKMSQ